MPADASPRSWVLPEEPAPVRLMSTLWADTDGVHDDFAGPADVDAWLEAVGVPLAGEHARDAELTDAIRLRDAVRRLAAHVTGDTRNAAASAMTGVDEAVASLNLAAGHVAGPRLVNRGGQLHLEQDGSVSRVRAGLAEVAEQSIHLLGDEAYKLRACYAPGCVLYFVTSHPRREWCSVACGNRARAARHYRRVRTQRGDQTGT
jgi:predicted RNA-binding Zn ribbon-like protein